MSLDYTNENSDDLKKASAGRTVAIVILGCAVMVGLASVGYKLVRGHNKMKEGGAPEVISSEKGETKGWLSFLTGWGQGEEPEIKFFQPIELRLDGIVTDPMRVMINRKLVLLGETINGVEVVDISAEKVSLKFQGTNYSLKVGETLKITGN